MKLWKWCEIRPKSYNNSSYKGEWVRTHQRFCRPDDVVFVETDHGDKHHFVVRSMPYKGDNEWTIDLQPVEWNGKGKWKVQDLQ